MRRFVVAIVSGVLAPLLSGCETDPFSPPPPPELASTVRPSIEPAVKVVEMVLRSEGTPDRATWSQVGRVDAGVSRVSFRSSAPASGDPPQRQAELIRKAGDRGASVVIVEPGPDPKVAEALRALKARGIPVLLLGRPPEGGVGEFPLVTTAAPADSARSLVKAAMQDAAAAKLPADGTAAIIVPRGTDVFTEDRVAALKEALKDAGVASPAVITYDGIQGDATKQLDERLKSDPGLTLVFAEDGEALNGAIMARGNVKKQRTFIVAGYSDLGPHVNEAILEQAAAVADRSTSPMAHAAFRLAMQLVNGKTIDPRTEVPVPLRRYSSKVAPDPVGPPSRPASEAGTPG